MQLHPDTDIDTAIEELKRVLPAGGAREFRLPFPPSVNDMFLNNRGRGKGRIKSPDYRAWIEQSLWELNAQRVKPFLERAIIHIDLDDTRNGDCDNRAKPVADVLVAAGILRGDSKKHVKRVSVGWEPITGCRVRVEAA